jgi:hypothetical protein
MPSYAGWYPRRRGILEHLEHGTISLLDAAVHDFLCLIADYRTGVAWASAKKIHALAGSGVTLRSVQRALERLESLGWIKRFLVCGKRGNYPTLIGRYFVRDASLNWLSVNLERTSDWRDVQFDPVTDPSFVGNTSGNRGDAENDTDVTPSQEVRSQEVRSQIEERESGIENVRETESGAFEGFDLPKNKQLLLSKNVFKSLFIDENRLTPSEREVLQKLAPFWEKSLHMLASGEMTCDGWIEEAIQNLKRARIVYPKILERRMHEIQDGRLRIA